MQYIEAFRRKPPEVQKLLLVLMICASEHPTAEIDYKRYCRPALEKWAAAFSHCPADHDESEAAAKVIERITEHLDAVLTVALKARSASS